MNNIAKAGSGPGYLWQGFGLIRQPGLRKFVIMPVLINVLVIAGLTWLFGYQLEAWLDYWLGGLPTWLAWLETLLWWLGFLLALLFFCYVFTLLANLIASPFNGLLSARVEEHLTGNKPDSDLSLWQETLEGIVGEGRKLLFYLWRALLLGVVSLILLPIPLVDGLIPVLWFLFGAFMLSMEYLDHPMANRGMKFPKKLACLRRQRALALSFGSTVTLITALPLVNLLVMPAAVAGATALWVDAMRDGDAAATTPIPTRSG